MGCGGSKAAAPAVVAGPVPEGDFKVQLQKAAESDAFGLTIVPVEGKALLVEKVKDEGLIPSWNEKHMSMAEMQVKEGDTIVAVNAVHGDAVQMKKELSEKIITLMFKRPVTDAASSSVGAAATEAATTVPLAVADTEVSATQQTPEEPAVEPVPRADASCATEPVTAAEAPVETATADETTQDLAMPDLVPRDDLAAQDLAPSDDVEQGEVIDDTEAANDARLCRWSIC